MRWILAGKNTAASRALALLAERGDEVWAIGTAGDNGRDGWQRSFRGTARRLGLRFDQPRRINAPAFVERLAEYDADRLISIQYDQILRESLFGAVRFPCLNLHFSLLPRHRGVNPVAWAILSGDAEAGVTLHHMVPDIDAGHVIDERRVAIDPGGTARELYDALSAACFELFRDSVPFSSALLDRRVPQDPALASYHRADDLDFGCHRADWSRPAADLHAWLRAMIFPPFQYPETACGGERMRIERVAPKLGPVPNGAEPGRIVARVEQGIEVAAVDGAIVIEAMARAGDPTLDAESTLADVAIGDRLH